MISYSCTKSKIHEKNFPLYQNIIANHIPINEIIKIGNIYKLKNYFILRNVQTNAEYNFYVYSLPTFKFLYSFCPKGNGANEYLLPTVIKNTPNNKFSFRDHGTDKYVTYELTDTCAFLLEEYQFIPNNNRFFWEINYINNDIYILKNSNSKQISRDLWNFKKHMQLDTLSNTFNLSAQMGRNYYTEFDDMWISASNNNIAFAYFFIDRIEFANIIKEKIELTNAIGETTTPDFYLFNKSNSYGKYKYNVDNNIVYYEDVYSTPQKVYGLYAGIPWGDLDKYHSSLIEIYSWEGKAIKQLRLNESISSMVIDETEKKIYGINPDLNEDSILVFNYN